MGNSLLIAASIPIYLSNSDYQVSVDIQENEGDFSPQIKYSCLESNYCERAS